MLPIIDKCNIIIIICSAVANDYCLLHGIVSVNSSKNLCILVSRLCLLYRCSFFPSTNPPNSTQNSTSWNTAVVFLAPWTTRFQLQKSARFHNSVESRTPVACYLREPSYLRHSLFVGLLLSCHHHHHPSPPPNDLTLSTFSVVIAKSNLRQTFCCLFPSIRSDCFKIIIIG